MESLQNSVIQYFLNDQWLIIQNHTLVINPFKVEDKPMDFNATE